MTLCAGYPGILCVVGIEPSIQLGIVAYVERDLAFPSTTHTSPSPWFHYTVLLRVCARSAELLLKSEHKKYISIWQKFSLLGTSSAVMPLAQALEVLLQRLSALKDPLNLMHGPPSVGLGLENTMSAQLARYAGDGRGYVRHRDTPKSAGDSEEAERKVCASMMIPSWLEDVGYFVIYYSGDAGRRVSLFVFRRVLIVVRWFTTVAPS